MHMTEVKKSLRIVASALTALLLLLLNVVFWYVHCGSCIFLLVFSALALLVSGLILLKEMGRMDFASFGFFAMALGVSGLVFMALFTPGSVPDEQYHFYRSYIYADFILGDMVDSASGTFAMRACDAGLFLDPMFSNERIQYVRDSFFSNDFDVSMTSFSVDGFINYSSNPFYIKLPSAFCIVIARVLGLGPLPLFYLGRLGNFLLFYFLALASVKITPVFSRGLKIVCLLPMTLHLVSSYSYDAGTIGLAILLSALVMRAFYSENKFSWGLFVAIAALAALLAPCKVIYSFIALLVLFVPSDKFLDKRQYWVVKASIPFVIALVVAFTRLSSIVSLSGISSDDVGLDVRGMETGTFYSISDTFENPFGTALMFIRTLDGYGDFYISGLVGGTLCWFQANIAAPSYIVFLYVAILVLGFIPNAREISALKFSNRVVFVIVAVVIWLCAMYSMYVGHTFNTEQYVLGVQGRYLLPALFILMVGASPSFLLLKESCRNCSMTLVLALNCFYLARVISIALAS